MRGGRASLLVPFAAAADDHQRKNAEVLVAAGAAEMLLQSEVTAETLLAALLGLLTMSAKREEMAARAKRWRGRERWSGLRGWF
jgi:UDP-N-acetylglucosamine--N-acetylmuramyl-(pentapeptide) pyrophosphoryl-undecaprenol N-acetylglucosamine transferase